MLRAAGGRASSLRLTAPAWEDSLATILRGWLGKGHGHATACSAVAQQDPSLGKKVPSLPQLASFHTVSAQARGWPRAAAVTATTTLEGPLLREGRAGAGARDGRAPCAAPLPARAYASDGAGGAFSFHRVADETLECLQDQFEALVEDEDVEGADVTCDSGVLEIDLGQSGTYVINKQAPNEQLWLSSPISGPFRYDYSREVGAWVYSRDNHRLEDKLSDELSDILGTPVCINTEPLA
mmetsp:Transcript_762/g.2031  ORF Transcript_762/g.2031 Transcript_762/m.2031 type:complete len:239 (+) Transcript_762:1181-1897(+)